MENPTPTPVELPADLVFDPAMLAAYDPATGFPETEFDNSTLDFDLVSKDPNHPMNPFLDYFNLLFTSVRKFRDAARDQQIAEGFGVQIEETSQSSFLLSIMQSTQTDGKDGIAKYVLLRAEILKVIEYLRSIGVTDEQWPTGPFNRLVEEMDKELARLAEKEGQPMFESQVLTRKSVSAILPPGSEGDN